MLPGAQLYLEVIFGGDTKMTRRVHIFLLIRNESYLHNPGGLA
jgi:hypothetical protein